MNKIITVIILIFGFRLSAQDLPEVIDTSQYAKSMAEVEGIQYDGMYRYFESGSDKPFNGILYARYHNGNFKSWQEYELGVGEGHWINFYDNGNMEEWGTYVQNKVEGPIRKYFENGILKAEGTYREWRVRVGKWIYYDESGNRVKVEDYGAKGDFRDVENYYRSGQISKQWYDSILEVNEKYQNR